MRSRTGQGAGARRLKYKAPKTYAANGSSHQGKISAAGKLNR